MTQWIVTQCALAGVLCSLTANAAAPSLGPGDREITVRVGTQTRTCLIHLPPAHGGAKLQPLLITLHASGQTGEAMAKMTGFNAMADKHGWMTAFPDGMIGKKRAWSSLFGTGPANQGVAADDVDHVAFIRSLIDTLRNSHHADPNRIFVCGHSSGAYMAYRVAIDLADRVAAAGVVNGSLGIRLLDGKPSIPDIPMPVAPVSVIHICGAKDNLVKFDGVQTARVVTKSVPDCIQHFVKANGCTATGKETKDAEHGVIRTLYTGGKAGTEVELVIVENCNHNWPFPPTGLSASQELWDFFTKHPKAAR